VPRSSGRTVEGEALTPGRARGRLLHLDEPLSFWGGVDPATGDIIDRHHPQAGENVAGRVLLMPSGRGSSSSSSVLAEAIRAGTAPAGIILEIPDRIIALGALVGADLYGQRMPVVVIHPGLLSHAPQSVTIRTRGGVAAMTIEGSETA
jgi:predicted aconitase with swiveling domain